MDGRDAYGGHGLRRSNIDEPGQGQQNQQPSERVSFQGVALLEVAGQLHSCSTIDISQSGIGVRSESHAFDTEAVKVIFQLPAASAVTEVHGRLARRDSNGSEMTWGVQFHSTPAEVESYVSANQTNVPKTASRVASPVEHTPELESLFEEALERL